MPDEIDYGKEWEKSTAIVDKYDGTLIDLRRKLGLTHIIMSGLEVLLQ